MEIIILQLQQASPNRPELYFLTIVGSLTFLFVTQKVHFSFPKGAPVVFEYSHRNQTVQ